MLKRTLLLLALSGSVFAKSKLDTVLDCPISLIENNYGRTITIIRGLELLDELKNRVEEGDRDFNDLTARCEVFRAKLPNDEPSGQFRAAIDTPDDIIPLIAYTEQNLKSSAGLTEILKEGLEPFVPCDLIGGDLAFTMGVSFETGGMREICRTRLGQRVAFTGPVFGPSFGIGGVVTGIRHELLMPKKAFFRSGQIVGFARGSLAVLIGRSLIFGTSIDLDGEARMQYRMVPYLIGAYIGVGLLVGYLPKTILEPDYSFVIEQLGLAPYADQIQNDV